MLAALFSAERPAQPKGPARKKQKAHKTPKASKSRAQNDILGAAAKKHLAEDIVILAPGELDDEISDLFEHLPGVAPLVVPFRSRNADGSIFYGEAVMARAAEIKAERDAVAKIARVETRRLNAAAKKAAGLAVRKPAKTVEIEGSDIPAKIRGRVQITDKINAKTGEALIISVTFRNKVYKNLVVWAGSNQNAIIAANDDQKAIDMIVSHSDNPRFRPSVKTVG